MSCAWKEHRPLDRLGDLRAENGKGTSNRQSIARLKT
jgi:hypothetical protein